MKIGQKGQAFEPFNLLLGAIFALMVLVIIISAISYFDNLNIEASKQKIISGLQAATKQPNKNQIEIKEVKIRKDSVFSPKSLSEVLGISKECIEIVPNKYKAIEYSEENAIVLSEITTNIYARCSTNVEPFISDCEISCQISFGEPFEED
ncbi:MAG: hypothetical protein QXD98_02475 [Candidatus Diapherotrites archaeon]